MNSDPKPASRRPSMPTVILVGAGIVAAASAAVALSRPGDKASEGAQAHGTAVPDQPVGSVEEKIAELEARMKQDPNDPVGWRMLGWSYFEIGDLMASAAAYRRAALIEPENAENWSSLGEALQSASTDVPPEAAAAFERALKIDATDPRARYFLAVQKDIKGEHEAAVTDWIALLKDTPPGAPWEVDLRRTIQQVADKHKIAIADRMPAPVQIAAATGGIPGPTPEQLAAASAIPPGEQSEMARGMVDRLANRLKTNPKDGDGWMRLMRARMVLGEPDAANTALRSGLAAFQGDATTQASLKRAAQELGVPGA